MLSATLPCMCKLGVASAISKSCYVAVRRRLCFSYDSVIKSIEHEEHKDICSNLIRAQKCVPTAN